MGVILPNTDDFIWMKQAIALGSQAKQEREVPVGAVVVYQNQCIGRGYNQVRQKCDPSAHAEIIAIREACQYLGYERLLDATLFVTLEPCVMCLGAILHARLSRLVFGARDFRTGAAGSQLNLANANPYYRKLQVDEGPCSEACENMLSVFFRQDLLDLK